MASEMGWGGMPLMRPSSLATRYQLYERDIIPERRIEPGQRYRARKNLAEHVSASLSFKSMSIRLILAPLSVPSYGYPEHPKTASWRSRATQIACSSCQRQYFAFCPVVSSRVVHAWVRPAPSPRLTFVICNIHAHLALPLSLSF